MALITVVCVIGVVSGELIGPVAQLRYGRRTDDDESGSGRGSAVRAELADDAFQFVSSDQPFLLEALGPKLNMGSEQRGPPLPWPEFSPVSMMLDNGPDNGGEVGLSGAQTSAASPSGGALADASFTSDGSSPPSSSFSQPYLFNSAPPPATGQGAVSPPPPPPPPPPLPPPPPPPPPPLAVPEPDSWLLMILGLGGVGLALRRQRAGAGRSPNGHAPERLRS